MRRLPVYILLDTSGSMRGEPIHSVNVGLQSLLSALRQDPYALESVYLSIITFDIEAREHLPLTALADVQISDLQSPSSGATFMGAALELLFSKLQSEIQKNTPDKKGDWRPMLFIMTDGSPSDVYAFDQMASAIKQYNFASIVACAAGTKAKTEYLKQLTDKIVLLDNMDANAFSSFFKWVSASVTSGSSSAGLSQSIDLPPPPAEIQFVL